MCKQDVVAGERLYHKHMLSMGKGQRDILPRFSKTKSPRV